MSESRLFVRIYSVLAFGFFLNVGCIAGLKTCIKGNANISQPDQNCHKGECISLIGGFNNSAITSKYQVGSLLCCYTYLEGKCYKKQSFKLTHEIPDGATCKITGINQTAILSNDSYITSKKENGNLFFSVENCQQSTKDTMMNKTNCVANGHAYLVNSSKLILQNESSLNENKTPIIKLVRQFNCCHTYYNDKCYNADEYGLYWHGGAWQCRAQNLFQWRNVTADFNNFKVRHLSNESFHFEVEPCNGRTAYHGTTQLYGSTQICWMVRARSISIKPPTPTEKCSSSSGCKDIADIGKYAVNFTTNGSQCCFEYEEGKCFSSSKHKLFSNVVYWPECLSNFRKWADVKRSTYTQFQVQTVENSSQLSLHILPCSEPTMQTDTDWTSHENTSTYHQNLTIIQRYQTTSSAIWTNDSSIITQTATTPKYQNDSNIGSNKTSNTDFQNINVTTSALIPTSYIYNQTTAPSTLTLSGLNNSYTTEPPVVMEVRGILLSFATNNPNNQTAPINQRKTMKTLLVVLQTLASTLPDNESQLFEFPTAKIQCARLPDISARLRFPAIKATFKSRLLSLLPNQRNGIHKRALKAIIVIFAQLKLDLNEWIKFFPILPATSNSPWLIMNNTQYYPSSQVPYISIQVLNPFDNTPISVSPVFSIILSGNTTMVDSVPARLYRVYRSWFKIISHDFVCLQMNVSETIGFSSHGCTTYTDGKVVTCNCDKQGLFTLVYRVVAQVKPAALDFIFSAGMILGLVFLALTSIRLLTCLQKVKCDRIFVQINLVLALLALHVTLVVEWEASWKKGTCLAVTCLTHYFLLATGCFAVVESFTIVGNLFTRSLRFKRLHPRRLVLIQLALGWGIPLITARATFKFFKDEYVTESQYGYDRCWFEDDSTALYAVVTIPITALFSICAATVVIIFSFASTAKRASHDVTEYAREYDVMTVGDVDVDHVFRMLFEHVVVCIALIVPWLLFFMYGVINLDAELLRVYVTYGLISVQGILVSIAYIMLNRDVRNVCGSSKEYSGPYGLYWYGPNSEDDIPMDEMETREDFETQAASNENAEDIENTEDIV